MAKAVEWRGSHCKRSWQCLTKLLGFPRNTGTQADTVASLSFDLGGCGLQSVKDLCASALGQLGGQPANDPSAAPGGGKHNDPESI